MKIKKSIVGKILSIIVITMIVMGLGMYIISSIQLKKIIKKSQNDIYNEKLNTIISIINRKYQLLCKTGLIEVYEDDFKDSLITSLRETYYNDEYKFKPFIFRTDGAVVLFKDFFRGDRSLTDKNYIQMITKMRNESLVSYSKEFGGKWYITKYFEPWNWIVVFSIPISVKYQNVTKFQKVSMFFILLMSTTASLILIYLIRLLFRPVLKLIDSSSAMASGDLDFSITKTSNDELGILTESFITMRNSIKNNINDLSRSKLYLSSIINSMPSVIVVLNQDGCIKQLNKRAEEATGIQINDAIGKKLGDIYPQFSIYQDDIEKLISTKQIFRQEKIISHLDNKEIYSKITAYPLQDNDIVGGVVVIIDDITKTVKLEKMMVQSEKMMSVGGLAAGMAHEINNPLSGIVQNAQVIQNRLGQDIMANKKIADELSLNLSLVSEYMKRRKIFTMLDGIRSSGERAADIVSNVLSFSKKDNSHKNTLTSINDLLDKTISLAKNDYNLKKQYDFKNIHIIKKYEKNLPYVECEPSKIQQVLFNILKNGAHEMNNKWINLGNSYQPTFILRTKKDMGYIQIEIEDNGPGIKDDNKKRIFEPFFTTKSVTDGTGLGMSVSYFIITEEHKGTLSVESKYGSWTKFIIYLKM